MRYPFCPFLTKPYTMLTYDKLPELRLQGDAPVDRVVSQYMQAGKASELYSLLQSLEHNRTLDNALSTFGFSGLLPYPAVPAWADADKMNAGRAVFQQFGLEIMTLLGVLSLPYCYAAAEGARVLWLAEKMRNQPGKRLLDTATFVHQVLDADAFAPQGQGLAAIMKVRLTHALVRFYVSSNAEYTLASVPVNQEDLLGTNLAFSSIVIKGLIKMGIALSSSEKEGFMHLWNVIGHLGGIDENILPGTLTEALHLEHIIAKHQFGPSEEGRALTSLLIEHFQKTLPSAAIRNLIAPQMRYFLGDKVSEIIGLPTPGLGDVVVSNLVAFGILKNKLFPGKPSLPQARRNLQMLREKIVETP